MQCGQDDLRLPAVEVVDRAKVEALTGPSGLMLFGTSIR
jgi:hypothetical protein